MFPGLPPRADPSLSWINWFEGRSAPVSKALGMGTGTVQRGLMDLYVPSTILIGMPRSMSRAWRSDSDNMSLALT